MKALILTSLLVASVASWYAASAYTSTPLPELWISQDGRALEFRRNTVSQAQSVDILRICGMPVVGEPRIISFSRDADHVDVTYGKHCLASVSIKDGAVKCIGCD